MHYFGNRFPAFTLLTALIFATPSFSLAGEEEANSAAEHTLQAEIALHRKDYLEASTEYRKAAELGESPEIARQATRLAFDFGFDDEALRAAKRWHDLDPDSDEALIHLAQIQLRTGDMRNARRNFTTLIERGDQPGDQRLFTLMGFISQEDAKRADQLMRSLAKPYADSALAQYAVAAVALQADELKIAMERAELAIELDPDWIKAKLLYARALLLAG